MFDAKRFPIRLRHLFAVIATALVTATAAADIREDLVGTWRLVDVSPALLHPSNEERFTIAGAKPEKSNWADGVFFLRWSGEERPERGYYSLATGRVWVTTYRYVNQKRERVEYRGTITRDGGIVWEGSAQTTGSPKTTWEFSATRN